MSEQEVAVVAGFLLLAAPFAVALMLLVMSKSVLASWLVSWSIIPAVVLLEEFVLPYSGGGVSFFPLSLIFGGFYGAVSGSLGVVTGQYVVKRRSGKN